MTAIQTFTVGHRLIRTTIEDLLLQSHVDALQSAGELASRTLVNKWGIRALHGALGCHTRTDRRVLGMARYVLGVRLTVQ